MLKMVQKKWLLSLIIFFSSSLVAGHSQTRCQEAFHYRKQIGELALGRNLNEKEVVAMESAHRVGWPKDGDIHSINISDYSPQKIREKKDILSKAGFSQREVQILMKNGNGLIFLDVLHPNIRWIQDFYNNNLQNPFIILSSSDFLLTPPTLGIIKKIEDNQALILMYDPSSHKWKEQEIVINTTLRDHYLSIEVTIVSKEQEGSKTSSTKKDGNLKSKISILNEENRNKESNINRYTIMPGKSEWSTVITNLKSEENKVDSFFPEVSKIAEEQKLREQGYDPIYTRGMDEVNQWLVMQEHFIKARVNPLITHITWLETQVHRHIEHIRKRVMSQPSTEDRQQILEVLAFLETEAEATIRKKKLTYYYWLRFNHLLSKVAYEKYIYLLSNKKLTSDEEYVTNAVDSFANLFPIDILVPTILGEVGIMTLNKGNPQGIYPIGLFSKEINKETIKRRVPENFNFFEHDLGHADISIRLYSDPLHRLFHEQLMKKVKIIPPQKRKNIELAYYLLHHEDGGFFMYKQPQEMKYYLSKHVFGLETEGLRSFSREPEQRAREMEQIANDWTEIWTEIKTSLK